MNRKRNAYAVTQCASDGEHAACFRFVRHSDGVIADELVLLDDTLDHSLCVLGRRYRIRPTELRSFLPVRYLAGLVVDDMWGRPAGRSTQISA